MSYNGWTNKETWLVNLWLGNLIYAEGYKEPNEIESLVDEMACALLDSPDSNGFLTDMLNCALGEINYHELAESNREELGDD